MYHQALLVGWTYHFVIITKDIIASFILLHIIKHSVHVFMSEFRVIGIWYRHGIPLFYYIFIHICRSNLLLPSFRYGTFLPWRNEGHKVGQHFFLHIFKSCFTITIRMLMIVILQPSFVGLWQVNQARGREGGCPQESVSLSTQ